MYVVAYDTANGMLAAARLWWMMRVIGHPDAAVLDGGLQAWRSAGFALATDMPQRTATIVRVEYDARQIVYTDELQRELATNAVLLDARNAPRFRGEVEPIDPVAGHVPGARNRPLADNLGADGTFKSAAALRAEFDALLAGRAARETLHMCGSGVTACHNLLAMEHAGLAGSRVYAPSWSGWIADATRPVARGEK
jgi:thiosulfate/3-mercaptopyruvate sulfurtransferase